MTLVVVSGLEGAPLETLTFEVMKCQRNFGNGNEGVEARGISERTMDWTCGQPTASRDKEEKGVKMIPLFWA